MMSKEVSRRAFLQVAASGAVAGWRSGLSVDAALGQARPPHRDWALNATIIEACSCTMFCPCYFSTVPSGHGHGDMAEHFCRFNMAYRVNQGHFGGVSLNGVKFWIAGDLGADFSKGARVGRDHVRAVGRPRQQRDAITTIVPHVYPVTWKAFTHRQGRARSTGPRRTTAPRRGSTAARRRRSCCAGIPA